MLIKLNSQDVTKCEKFASEINTDFYNSRNQFNSKKRLKDQVIGKLGEIAVYKYLFTNNKELSYPDFEIYTVKRKSWSPDLISSKNNFLIKSQDINQAAKFSPSWMFQLGDKHVFKEFSEKDLVCFVLVDLDKREAEIKAIIKLEELHNKKLFKEPKLDYLKNNKRAVYFEDLKKDIKPLFLI